MAVLDKLEADIRVNGQPLLEYNNDDPEEDSRPQIVVRYVEAPTDAAFAIHVRIPTDYQMTSEGIIFRFEADGKRLTNKIVSQKELQGRANDREIVIVGTRGKYESGALNRRPLQFTEINFEEVASLIDSATISSSHSGSWATSSPDELEDLGTVTVKVFKVKNIREADDKSFGDTDRSLNPIKASKEKLDAQRITLRVTFGAPQPHSSSVGRVSDQVGDSPIATFIFKYRTKQSLLHLNVRRAGLNTQQEPIGELTVGELRAEHRVHQSSGTTTSRRSSGVSQQLQLISSSPQTPENQFYDSVRSRRRGSSATATPTPARYGLSREPPEPVTSRSPMAFSPPEPVSRRGSLTPTTPSGGLFMDPRIRNPVPTTPSTIATIPEESPSENTPRAYGRKRTHSTSSPTIPPEESTSTDSVNATSAAPSKEDETTEPHVRRPLRKGSVYLPPRSAFAGPATVRQSVRRFLPLPAVEIGEKKKRKIEEHEAEMEDRRDKEDEEMAGNE